LLLTLLSEKEERQLGLKEGELLLVLTLQYRDGPESFIYLFVEVISIVVYLFDDNADVDGYIVVPFIYLIIVELCCAFC